MISGDGMLKLQTIFSNLGYL